MEQLLQPINDPGFQPNLQADNRTFRERLVELFGPTDWVQVINPDTSDFTWAYMPADKEEVTYDTTQSTVPMKNVYRPDPELYRLTPGQSATLVGANAYIMIEGLAKQLIAKRAIEKQPNMQPGQARKFNFTDGIAQQALIKEIYLGKNMPNLVAEKTQETPDEQKAEIDDVLGLNDAEQATVQTSSTGRGRPPKATASS